MGSRSPLWRLIALAGALGLGACASIVEGTSQNVTVTTDPAGAICKLSRDGTELAVVNPTPGSVRIGKSKDDVSIRCEKAGHQSGFAGLGSEFQGMTFGNLIFGGIVGVAIDAGSGAMHVYPETVVVILPPEKFPTAAERDAFFDRQKTRVGDAAAAQIAKIAQQCGRDEMSRISCEEQTKKIEAARDTEIARFESQRQIARVN
jgi:hypothetical protein